jgi:hypothetical protein
LVLLDRCSADAHHLRFAQHCEDEGSKSEGWRQAINKRLERSSGVMSPTGNSHFLFFCSRQSRFLTRNEISRRALLIFSSRDLGTSDKIRGEPVADRFGGDIGGAVLRVDLGALLREALLRPGYIVADVGRGAVANHNFAGLDFNQLISYRHTPNFLRRPAADRIDRHRYVDGVYRHFQLMRGRRRAGAAIEIKLQGIAQSDGDTLLRRSLPRRDWRDHDLGELVANAFVAQRRISAIKRLKAPGDQTGRGQRQGEPDASANLSRVTGPCSAQWNAPLPINRSFRLGLFNSSGSLAIWPQSFALNLTQQFICRARPPSHQYPTPNVPGQRETNDPGLAATSNGDTHNGA